MIYHAFMHTIPAAYSLLPDAMKSDEATAMLLAIGLQESRFQYRRQLPRGPARGFWQFERAGGVAGVLSHQATRKPIRGALASLQYATDADDYACHSVIEHNDVLACCFARLLLWTLPDRLPGRLNVDGAWHQYIAAWRPGKPHPQTWPQHYAMAWSLVSPEVLRA